MNADEEDRCLLTVAFVACAFSGAVVGFILGASLL